MGDLVLILTVMAFAFLVKAIAGFGGPLLAVPLLAPFLGVEHAVVAITIGNLVSNGLLLWQNREGSDRARRLLVRLLVPGALTAILGTILLTELPDGVLLGIVGFSVLVYIAIALRRPDLQLGFERGLRTAIPIGIVGGFVHGTTGNSGTVFGTFLHSLSLPRAEFMFAVTNVFLILGSVQVATLIGRGSYTGERLVEALLAVIPVMAVTPLGAAISRRLDPRSFGRVVLALLAVAGIRLILAAFGV